ncbi:hypothetical protein Syun_007172 [Stephania yunnanensis]|uniref:RNase H type-1 domain-containing protein n=1 Tax=Stephania yunnanensis TaxID=152371 RepID=A0AAP0KYA9_9MAGN
MEWQSARRAGFADGANQSRKGVAKWKKPKPEEFKCNVDVVVFKDGGVSSYGVVLLDDLGTSIAAMGGKVIGVVERREVEAIGVREALSWVKGRGINGVFIETDAEMMLKR